MSAIEIEDGGDVIVMVVMMAMLIVVVIGSIGVFMGKDGWRVGHSLRHFGSLTPSWGAKKALRIQMGKNGGRHRRRGGNEESKRE